VIYDALANACSTRQARRYFTPLTLQTDHSHCSRKTPLPRSSCRGLYFSRAHNPSSSSASPSTPSADLSTATLNLSPVSPVLGVVGTEHHNTLPMPSLSSITASLPNHDRATWARRIQCPNEGGPRIGNVFNALGLKRCGSTGIKRGVVAFTNHEVGRLANEIALLAEALPRDASRLVQIASSPDELSIETGDLLQKFGRRIWIAGDARQWLLKGGDVENYPKDLKYSNQADRVV